MYIFPFDEKEFINLFDNISLDFIIFGKLFMFAIKKNLSMIIYDLFLFCRNNYDFINHNNNNYKEIYFIIIYIYIYNY